MPGSGVAVGKGLGAGVAVGEGLPLPPDGLPLPEGFAVSVGFGRAVAFGVGFGVGFGVALGVGWGVGLAVGFGVGLGVGVGVAVGFGVGFGVGLGVGVGVGVGFGVGDGPVMVTLWGGFSRAYRSLRDASYHGIQVPAGSLALASKVTPRFQLSPAATCISLVMPATCTRTKSGASPPLWVYVTWNVTTVDGDPEPGHRSGSLSWMVAPGAAEAGATARSASMATATRATADGRAIDRQDRFDCRAG
jgi:hypothetical protein